MEQNNEANNITVRNVSGTNGTIFFNSNTLSHVLNGMLS